MPGGMTRREAICIYLNVREGWSYRDIAGALRCNAVTVMRDVEKAIQILAASAECNSYPITEQFFSLWRDGEQHRKPRYVALRRDRLAQDLESQMEQRSDELAQVSECMGANRPVPHKRNKGHAWTQWESRYLNATKRASIPPSAYGMRRRKSRGPARFCAADHATCELQCAGCDHEQASQR